MYNQVFHLRKTGPWDTIEYFVALVSSKRLAAAASGSNPPAQHPPQLQTRFSVRLHSNPKTPLPGGLPISPTHRHVSTELPATGGVLAPHTSHKLAEESDQLCSSSRVESVSGTDRCRQLAGVSVEQLGVARHGHEWFVMQGISCGANQAPLTRQEVHRTARTSVPMNDSEGVAFYASGNIASEVLRHYCTDLWTGTCA